MQAEASRSLFGPDCCLGCSITHVIPHEEEEHKIAEAAAEEDEDDNRAVQPAVSGQITCLANAKRCDMKQS
ncbi:TPA: hypothetical protein ACH3X3_004035 [Trebouxia sp. C0006]